jgi:hypothetical protein
LLLTTLSPLAKAIYLSGPYVLTNPKSSSTLPVVLLLDENALF